MAEQTLGKHCTFEGNHGCADQDKDSITRTLDTRDIFKEQLKDLCDGNLLWRNRKMSDLGFAPHRFTSAEKPLCTASLGLLQLCAMVQKNYKQRASSSKEHQSALKFAKWAAQRRFILMGAMADGASEILNATRFFDTEGFDPTETRAELSKLVTVTDILFRLRRCLDIGSISDFL